MGISQYVKEIGRGPRGSKPLTREQAADLFGQLLDGNVTDAAITTELAQCHGTDADRLAQLQGKLRCGTNCGSCLPELKRMVRSTGPLASKHMAQAAT